MYRLKPGTLIIHSIYGNSFIDGLNEEGFEMPERGHSYPRLNTEDDYDVVTHAQVESETALSQPLLNGR